MNRTITASKAAFDIRVTVTRGTATDECWVSEIKGTIKAPRGAERLETPRTITIGNTGKEFDGSKDISWTLEEIGALDHMYPVNSIYMSLSATSPASLFGGTWTALPAGRFPISAGTGYAAGSTGGAATHTLTVEESARHNHDRISFAGNPQWTTGDNSGIGGTQIDTHTVRFDNSGLVSNTAVSHWCTNYSGNNQPHNNMPPYYAVYMWRRTA